MIRLIHFSRALIFIPACLWLLGCATSPPTKFYLLSPIPGESVEDATAADHKPAIVRVEGVTIAGYLDRHEIVTRISENEIHLADLNQWGEPLRDAFTNLLALNLSRLLPARDFVFFPFKCPSPAEYEINVEILRMDGTLNGDVHLTAQWSILKGMKGMEGDIVAAAKSVLKASSMPTDYGELVAAESQLVEQLSREIAASIQTNL